MTNAPAVAQAGLDLGPLIANLSGDLALTVPGSTSLMCALLRFLTTKAVLGDADATRFSPCAMVDHAWHALILDTRLYAAVCDALAGQMLHHAPSGGLPRNKAARAARREATASAHAVLFGCAEVVEFCEASKKRKAVDGFALTVKSLTVRQTRLQWPDKTAATLSVLDLHHEYARKEGVPICQLRFVFNGNAFPSVEGRGHDDETEREVADRVEACLKTMQATTLESMGVAHNASIHVVLKLSGC